MSLTFVIALVLPLTLLSGLVGIVVGRRLRQLGEPERQQLQNMQVSLLGLLALLLGFSFAMAETRYEQRRELIIEETNAIGTARLRAGALGDDHGRAIEHLLDDYVATRIRGFRARDDAGMHAAVDRSVRLQADLWTQVTAVTREQPQSLPASLLMQSANEVIDLHTKRVAAARNHVPTVVLLMLLLVAAVTMGWVGASVGAGQGGGIATTVSLSLLIVLVIGVIVDLDSPRAGLIRVSQAALVDLQRSLE